MKKVGKLALFCSALGLVACSLAATVLSRLSNQDLATRADAIVVGTCTKIDSQWLGRELITLVSFDVHEMLKGKPRPTVTVVLPGGVDLKGPVPLAMDYGDAPRMVAGEEDVLFLQAIDQVPQGFVILGYTQGKFTVYPDAKQGRMVTRDLQRVVLLKGKSLERGTPLSMTLAQLKEEIRRYLAPKEDGAKK